MRGLTFGWRLFFSTWVTSFVLAGTLSAAVAEPWVTTDQTVDCASYESIVKGVIKDGMTEEQKAIAMYSFFRQRVYHYQDTPESRDPIKNLNVLGYTLCGSQGTCMKGLLNAAGIKVRVVSHPGHTFYEAFYDEKWHGFDTFTNFYVFTRGDKKNIASFEELAADPTLISDAVKENRAAPNMCPCGDPPMAFKQKVQVLDYEPKKLSWAVKNNVLRKGEELVRSWWPNGKPVPGSWNPKASPCPLHTCGGNDRKAEPELFKVWEPYCVYNLSKNISRSYRHYFNGVINYSPNLTTDDYKDGLLSETGVKTGAEGLSGAGEVVMPVVCSFYISAAQCIFESTCPAEGDSVTLALSTDGKKWTDIVTAKDTGKKQYVGDLNAVAPGVGKHAYQIKFVLKGNAVLNKMLLQTYFTHNATAAPHLVPGKNNVTVTIGKPETLTGADLKVIYRYKDAPDWKGELKTIEKAVTASPFTFEAELPASEKMPQMLDLTLRNGALAWMPENAWPLPAAAIVAVPAPKPAPAPAPAPAK